MQLERDILATIGCLFASSDGRFLQKTSKIAVGTGVAKNSFVVPTDSLFTESHYAMQTLPRTLLVSSVLLGICMVLNGLYALGQTSLDVRSDSGWRRTSIGWEHADSLPIASKLPVEQTELAFPTLTVPMDRIEYVHRLIVPLAISGFMACMGPWMLLRWPTIPIEKH